MTVPKPARLHVENLPTVFPNAAGLDIGSAEIVAALPPDRAATVVRAFTTFTADLRQLVTWLVQHQIDTVAMESTGVYWIPIYEMLEAAGLRVFLVNARHFKIVPGRKSDYNDAQWLQRLHALGLLTGSFRPDEEMCVLRSLLRHRAQLIEHRAPHILHMLKALKLMNLQLPEVLADVTGVTGLAILRAIVAGERRGAVLAHLRRPGCRHTEQDIVQALTGTWREEHLFVLAQSLDLYDFYTRKITECDQRLDQQFSSMRPRFDLVGPAPAPPKSRTKKNSNSKNQPAYNVRALGAHPGAGSGRQYRGLRVTGADHPVGNRDRPVSLPHEQALLFLARAGAAHRHLWRQGVALPDHEGPQPRRAGAPASRAVMCPIALAVWRLLPGPSRAQFRGGSHRRHRAQDCTRHLSHAHPARGLPAGIDPGV